MAEKNDKNKLEEEASRSLAVLLPQLDNGVFNAQASDELRDLVAAMRDDALNRGSKSKGKLTITLDLQLDNGVFDVKAGLAVKAPKGTFGRTTMWATDGNNLVAENPKQERLPFRRVEDAPAPVRKVDEPATPVRKA